VKKYNIGKIQFISTGECNVVHIVLYFEEGA